MRDSALWAAMWWADQLRRGQVGRGAGDATFEKSVQTATELLGGLPPLEGESIRMFEILLSQKIDSLLNDVPEVHIYREYDVPDLLQNAMAHAKVPNAAALRFPNKTGMIITAKGVDLKEGYGANYRRVFPEASSR